MLNGTIAWKLLYVCCRWSIEMLLLNLYSKDDMIQCCKGSKIYKFKIRLDDDHVFQLVLVFNCKMKVICLNRCTVAPVLSGTVLSQYPVLRDWLSKLQICFLLVTVIFTCIKWSPLLRCHGDPLLNPNSLFALFVFHLHWWSLKADPLKWNYKNNL